MERNYMTIYKRIKETVTALDAAQMYGMNVRSNGMTNCPFHEDHTPSLKLDKHFYCFGCYAHGDVIDFVSRLFGISRYDAAQIIAADFGIYDPPPAHPNAVKNNAEPYRPSAPFCIFLLRDYLHLLWIWRLRYEPTTITEVLDDRYVEACKNIPIVNDLIDDLRDGDKEFQNRALAVLRENENWKKLQDYVNKYKKEGDACGEGTNNHCA